uniref:hypothetical protein n=1 Tax=Candidatus Sororendozoicomonas aggregata TaxID=3073239 RepID=UPI002ED0C51E
PAQPQGVKSSGLQKRLQKNDNGRKDLLSEIRQRGGKTGKQRYKKPANPTGSTAIEHPKKTGIDLRNSPLLQRIDNEQESRRQRPPVMDFRAELDAQLRARRKGISGNDSNS